MSLRLYDIAEQYRNLLANLVDDETGVVDETALAKLDQLKDPLETKCINVCRYFKELEAEKAAIEKERKAMAAREKTLKNEIQSLKFYLQSNMVKCNITEIKSPQFVIKLCKGGERVDYDDENLLPDIYKRISV